MDMVDLFHFLRPETLKTILRDVTDCQSDPRWMIVRDTIMELAAGPMLDSDERNRFLRFDPGP